MSVTSPPPSPDDHALLRAFVAGDQAAFAVLLRRHERMVFCTSLRVLHDAASAQDAAQQAFLLLARHAARLRPPVVIAGWLYTTARHQAETLRRYMHRRQLREQRAAADLYDPPSSSHERERVDPSSPVWHDLSPHLDAALAKLPARLRDAVVLCLLENQDRATAAAQLNCSPDALAKRLTRALDQLRARLSRPGKPVTAAALAVLLSQHGSESHAATLAPAVLSAPLAHAATTGLTFATAMKLGTAAALLALGTMFVIRTFASAPTATSANPPAAATPVPPSPARTAPASQPPSPTPPAIVFSPDAPSRLAQIPDTNPYKPALVAYEQLQEKLKSANPPTAEERQAALDTIHRSLAAGRAVPEVDWGVDYAQGAKALVNHVSPANQLTQTLLKELPASSAPETRRDQALDVLALGRHLGRDGCLVELLTGIAVSNRALDQLESLLADLSPADAAALAADLRKLPAAGTLATAIGYEKAFFVDSFVGAFLDELTAALAKSATSRPADAAASSLAVDTPEALARFLANLHLHGLVQEGAGTRVGLRFNDDLFWLAPGETRRGVTLLSASVSRGNAMLVVQSRPVLLDLEKGSFTVPALDVLEAAARALPPDSLCALILRTKPSGTLADLVNELETSTRQLSTLLNDVIENPERFENETEYRKRVEQLSPTARNAAPSLPRVIKLVKTAQSREFTLLAQLDARAAAR